MTFARKKKKLGSFKKVISDEATDPGNVVPVSVSISGAVITAELSQLTMATNMVFITKYINMEPERICVES